MDVGNPVLLELADQSPLAVFAEIAPGDTLQLLYNNLFRAPLWEHQAAETDFLVVRYAFASVPRKMPTSVVCAQKQGQVHAAGHPAAVRGWADAAADRGPDAQLAQGAPVCAQQDTGPRGVPSGTDVV